MAFQPIVNNNFASVSFSPAWGYGDVPVTMQFQFDDLPDPMTQQYITGTLLAQGSTPSHLVIYDSTAMVAQDFKGVFFDELAPNPIVTGANSDFANVAINDRPSTLWLYDVLIGANLSHTDIDALVTAGVANVLNQYENGVLIKVVQFKGMGVGA